MCLGARCEYCGALYPAAFNAPVAISSQVFDGPIIEWNLTEEERAELVDRLKYTCPRPAPPSKVRR